MNKLKRMLAVLLTCAALFALAMPAQASYFYDIYDPAVSKAVDTLYALGVVNGTPDGTYKPEGNLTRVTFCKMAIEIMGRGEDAKAQMNRTIFTDVGSKHWGRGYANLAATMIIDETNKTRLMPGTGNGRFEPDRDITYQEAITLVLRILGYSAEANSSWPYGAIRTAGELGLDQGLNIASYSAAITRGQAALLFTRMLSTTPKGKEQPFAAALGTLVEDTIVLSTNSTVNGQSGWVTTSKGGPYRPAGQVDSELVGQRGNALLDKNGRFVTLLTDSSSSVTVTITRTQGNYLHTSDGSRYTFLDNTPVYTGTNGAVSTYKEMLPSLLPGQVVTVYLENGQVIGLYCAVTTAESGFVVVQGSVSAATFYSITGSDYNYTIRKNGSTISMNEIRPYDVATYDPISKVLNICDTRLSCVYENASPSPYAPSVITAAGGNTFHVMADAMDSIAKYSIGQTFTLLFTADGQVAGAASGYGAGSNAMGVVSGNTLKLIGTNVTLKLDSTTAEQYAGQLVSVYGVRGGLSLSSVNLNYAPGNFDKFSMTLGRLPVSDSVQIYEQGADGLALVALSSLPSTVPAAKISGYRTNSSGYVDLIIIRDFTGDTYSYGLIEPASRTENAKGTAPYTKGETSNTWKDAEGRLVDAEGNLLDENGNIIKNTIQQLKFTTPSGSKAYDTSDGLPVYSTFGTIRIYTHEGKEYAAVQSTLTAVRNARSADFYEVNGTTYVQVGTRTYEVASDVLCYNGTASTGWWVWDPSINDYTYVTENQWFSNLLEARTFSPTLTLYVDSTGGKVRAVST